MTWLNQSLKFPVSPVEELASVWAQLGQELDRWEPSIPLAVSSFLLSSTMLLLSDKPNLIVKTEVGKKWSQEKQTKCINFLSDVQKW